MENKSKSALLLNLEYSSRAECFLNPISDTLYIWKHQISFNNQSWLRFMIHRPTNQIISEKIKSKLIKSKDETKFLNLKKKKKERNN